MQKKFNYRFFSKDPPSRLTVRRIYDKFCETRGVTDNYAGNSGRRQIMTVDENVCVFKKPSCVVRESLCTD
jgi:hypothetical protein